MKSTPMKVQIQDQVQSLDELPVGQVFSCAQYKKFCIIISHDLFAEVPFDGSYPNLIEASALTDIKPVPSKLIIG